MKIAIYNVTTGLQLGGIEIYCIEMAKALTRLGHEVTLIAGSCNSSTFIDELSTIRFPFIARERFWNLGTRFRKLMERLSFARHAYSHLHTNGYDAIILTKPYDFPLAWHLKARGYQGRIVFHTGGTDFFTSDRFFFRSVDHPIACSRYTASRNEARYQRPFQIIYNGVDTDHFKPLPRDPQWRRALNIPPDAIVVMSAGRLVGLKGLGTLVRAIATLDNVHYVYIGQGPYAATLENHAALLGITQRIHAAGALPHDRIATVMSEADIFAQPSIGEEAFGITLIEAMACALPVLASAQGGMLEIIEHERDGLLIPPADASAWHTAIARLCADADFRKRLSMAARTSVEHRFTWHAAAARLDNLLNSTSAR